jgi:uncharacterized protein YbjT (DUF2867 family)
MRTRCVCDFSQNVDLTNSPSFEDSAALNFFQTSARNLISAETAAGVQHHFALSIAGADHMVNLVHESHGRAGRGNQNCGCPYTIVRATQFFEFIGVGLMLLKEHGALLGTVRFSNWPVSLLSAISPEE